LPDLVEEGKTGFFCDPLDARSMAGAIGRVFQNKSLAHDLAKRAKMEALARFRPEVIARRHVEIYHEVLSGGLQNRNLNPGN
jgi:glycosyltransferase involved in cell wall biosynthesis